MALAASPSILFDAVGILAGPAGEKALSANPDAESFLMDAKRHLKAIGLAGVDGLAGKAGITGSPGVVELDGGKNVGAFIEFAKKGKVWERAD
jgi:catalase